jgi:hypothetical protein
MRLTTRRRLFIDKRVQGGLLVRTAAYWFFLLVTGLLLQTLFASRESGGSFFERYGSLLAQYGVAAIAMLLLLPLVLYDVLLTSNRFAGPVYRLRRSLAALAKGQHVDPVQFRENDYWREMADEFNAVAAYVDELKRQARIAEIDNRATRDFQAVVSE